MPAAAAAAASGSLLPSLPAGAAGAGAVFVDSEASILVGAWLSDAITARRTLSPTNRVARIAVVRVRKSAAPRLESLDGKTIYLVDCRFDDSIELLKQVAVWFAAHMPNVTTRIVSLSATYQKDDPKTWNEIKANGDAAIIGVGHCSNCAPAVTTHAITLETKYGVPTVALHTDKFDKVVASVARMAGLPEAPRSFVPQPVMGKTAAELAAYVNGNDPITGRPVMQEVVLALTAALDSVHAGH